MLFLEMMKRWLSLMLLIGAMLGILAQETAFASALPMQMSEQTSAPAGMSEDCAEMMGLTAQSEVGQSEAGQQPEKPCEGLTLDCIAKMGCALPVALVPPAMPAVQTVYRPNTPTLMPVARLVGRNLSPEPEPPAILG